MSRTPLLLLCLAPRSCGTTALPDWAGQSYPFPLLSQKRKHQTNPWLMKRWAGTSTWKRWAGPRGMPDFPVFVFLRASVKTKTKGCKTGSMGILFVITSAYSFQWTDPCDRR